jgi:hypothetical protein
LAQARLLLFAQTDLSFARVDAMVVIVLFVFALSASGAILVILELSQPFTGFMQISSAPLRNALASLGR